MLPFAALIPGAIKFVKSGGAKKLVQGVGRLFKKKDKGKNKSANSGFVNPAFSVPALVTDTKMATTSKSLVEDKKEGGVWDQIGDAVGKVTKPSREFDTNVAVDNKTLWVVGGAVVLLALVWSSKK